ncbi:unnamed protein product [Owenia fusiformis]|uniref:Exosome complex component MTR3 n=1 Tax=Owenia fusiformis TaxID=6347 RepID=A0A8J1UV84_OWEFU|nr:unnamed protein product [Owenia fusiformis]
MPVDNRRLWTPEETIPPEFITKYRPTTELVNQNGKRRDGREANQHRPTYLKAGAISQAKGSAYIEMADTKVIAAVYGPREVMKREDFTMSGQVKCVFKFATFSCKTRQKHIEDDREKELSMTILEALKPAIRLDKFPKARLEIFITVLQDGGSALAAAITCGSVAVADAGMEMYDVVIGCSLRQIGERSLIDPTTDEESHRSLSQSDEKSNETSQAMMTVALMPSINQVSSIIQKGELSIDGAKQALKQCLDTARKLHPVIKQCLNKAVEAKLKR